MAGVFNILLMFILAIGFFVSLVGIPVIGIYWFAVFFGTHQRIAKAEKKLEDTLMHGESLVTQGMQLRPFAFFSRRKLVGITNSRVIMISRGLFGGSPCKIFSGKIYMMQKSLKTRYPTFVVLI